MKPEQKEMLSVTEENGRKIVRVNYSSMDLINTCMRKSHYLLHRKLRSKEESAALKFGSAIHKALETWYLSPIEERTVPPNAMEKAQLLNAVDDFPSSSDFPAFVRAIRNFRTEATGLPEAGDKRSAENGCKILGAYCKQYQNDGLTVYHQNGKPLVEKTVEFPIWEQDELKVIYFGTMDVVLENKEAGTIMVCDHKTTSVLGSQFYNRLKPNHQYTGYLLGARENLGIDTNLFMVNGLQVAKTKQEFARQITTRNEEDFCELQLATVQAVSQYLDCLEHDLWPQNAPNPCTMYGGCAFLKICEVPRNLRENVISAMWTEDS